MQAAVNADDAQVDLPCQSLAGADLHINGLKAG